MEERGIDPHGTDLDMNVIVPITTLMNRLMNVNYIAGAKFELEDASMTEEIAGKITSVLRERHSLNNNETNDFSIVTPVVVKEIIPNYGIAIWRGNNIYRRQVYSIIKNIIGYIKVTTCR